MIKLSLLTQPNLRFKIEFQVNPTHEILTL